jgi:hypothetical protein
MRFDSKTDHSALFIANIKKLCNYASMSLCDHIKEPRLSVVIIIARMRWAGLVARMDENCMPRRLMYVQPERLIKVGRPCARWSDEVGKDAGSKELVGNSHE